MGGGRSSIDQIARHFGNLGFETIAGVGLAATGGCIARVNEDANLGEQRLERAKGGVFLQTLEPAIAW